MVVLTDEDLADLPLPTARSIEVVHFMPAEQLDPILLNRSYFVEPESAGARAYVLLRDSLDRSGKVALTLVALRQRETLATLRTRDGVLVLETLLWPDEVRVPDFPFLDEDIEVRSQELKMAASLIQSMTKDFDPDAYHDNYREALQEVIDAKVEGREVVQPESVGAAAGPTSLADALKASLAAVRGTPAQAGEIETEVKAAPRRAIVGDTATRPTAGRAGHATGGGGRGGRPPGASTGGGTEQGRAGDGPARGRAAGAGTGRARTSGAGNGGARASGARASGVEEGRGKDGTRGTPAAKSGAGSTSPQPRSRHRAS
jgi:DNA end-binding protein Ku